MTFNFDALFGNTANSTRSGAPTVSPFKTGSSQTTFGLPSSSYSLPALDKVRSSFQPSTQPSSQSGSLNVLGNTARPTTPVSAPQTPSQSGGTFNVSSLKGTSTPTPSFTPPPVTSTQISSNLPPSDTSGGVGETPQGQKSLIQQRILDLLETDNSGDKQAIRDELELAKKEEAARKLANKATEREREYDEQIEELKKNADGKLAGALQADINDLEQQKNKELADLSIQYNVALGDYKAADATVQARIADMDAEVERQLTVLQTAYDFVNDDMTEAEKVQAEQAFKVKFENLQTANDKEIAAYKESITGSQFTSSPSDIAVAGGGIYDIMASSAQFDKVLSQTERTSMTKALNVAGQLGNLSDLVNLDSEQYGPIIGRIRGLNPFDTNAQEFKALIQGTVPNLARGIYGEVGVLTDTDIKNYAQTLPTLSSTEEVQDAMLGLTLKLVRDSVRNQLSVAAQNGIDVSGNVAILDQLDSTVGEALAPINMKTPQVEAMIQAGADSQEIEYLFKKGYDIEDVEEYYMGGGSSSGGSFDQAIAASAEAIASIESGGDYNAIGPVVQGGQYAGEQALGKYQVMPGNIPQWSQEALGFQITPEQFLANPEYQDAIFAYQFGKAAQQYGTLEDAASVWFSGRPLAKAGNASDVLGTTVPDYVRRFSSNLYS